MTQKVKDNFSKAMEELDKYYEDTPPISSKFAFEICTCKLEQENHNCSENCKEFKKSPKFKEK